MKKITQNEIAEILNVKQPTVSKYINGKLDLSIHDAIKLNEKLNIPYDAWKDIKSYLSSPSEKSIA